MTPRIWLAGLLSLALSTGYAQHAAPPILPLSELHRGQTGEGRTVLQGTTIESFSFEVLDVLETDGFAGNLVLIHCSGPVIERCGGIAAGMSGSPLFIDGKLIGAVAFTTPFADTTYGYATPIEDMLKVLDFGTAPVRAVSRGLLDDLPAGTPIMVGGLRGRAFEMLRKCLAKAGQRAVQEPDGPTVPANPQPPETDADLVEGSAIGASLSTGDIVLTALGTLTWRDGDRILAFGHPFLQRGPTSLFLHPAYIYGVVPSMELPFKVGAPAGPPLGSFVQDRSSGLGGLLGRPAASFGLKVTASDQLLKRDRTLNVRLIQDEALAPTLVAVTIMQAMSEVTDRAGGGTAEVEWTITGTGLAQPLTRKDMVYSAEDLLSAALPGPLFALDALLRNDFAAVEPQNVDVRVAMTSARKTARLVSVTCTPTTVKPGEMITVTVHLQPFRAKAIEQTLKLRVPDDTPAGKLIVDLHGRPEALDGPLSQAALMLRGLAPPASLAELVAALGAAQRGNALAAELLTPEAAALREAMSERLRALGPVDLFSDELQALPTIPQDVSAGGGEAMARAEAILEQVVQGRLRATVQVTAP